MEFLAFFKAIIEFVTLQNLVLMAFAMTLLPLPDSPTMPMVFPLPNVRFTSLTAFRIPLRR